MTRFLTVSYLFLITVINVRSRVVLKSKNTSALFTSPNQTDWIEQAQNLLHLKAETPLNTRLAKNVVFFLGDGMSLATIAATRAHIGNRMGFLGEDLKMSFDFFTHTGLARTYCVDRNVPDCGCSATAYLAGVKANFGTIGVSPAVTRGDCLSQRKPENILHGLMAWAQKAHKATGIVTTTRVTQPSPAAAYAHSAEVQWEADTDLPTRGHRCDDIASQLVRSEVGSKIDVVLGGGRKYFFPKTEKDAEGYYGYRGDGEDLIKEWVIKRESYGAVPKYVYNRDALKNLDINIYNSVLGLFSPENMPYHTEMDSDDPTLSQMAEKAIQILSKKPYGYFLFIEGGKIDIAHHETNARRALDETVEFAKTVKTILNYVNYQETLVIVTADHSHTMTYNGYSKRGSDVLGFANMFNASDNLPYTILSYANGPGYRPEENNQRRNLAMDDMSQNNYTYPALVPMASETHGGEDVAVYAVGPWSHLFTGSYEQNFLPHAIAYAACIGPGFTNCKI